MMCRSTGMSLRLGWASCILEAQGWCDSCTKPTLEGCPHGGSAGSAGGVFGEIQSLKGHVTCLWALLAPKCTGSLCSRSCHRHRLFLWCWELNSGFCRPGGCPPHTPTPALFLYSCVPRPVTYPAASSGLHGSKVEIATCTLSMV